MRVAFTVLFGAFDVNLSFLRVITTRRPSKLYLTRIEGAVFFVMLKLLQGDEQKAFCASCFVLMLLRSRV